MATSLSQYAACRLVEDSILELKVKASRKPLYNGLLVTGDKLLVIDNNARNLQLYSRSDGKLLSTSHRLESCPTGICLITKTEVAVCLLDSAIVILSFESMDDVKRVKILNVRTGFYSCHSVAKLNSSDQLVVSGRKRDDFMLYWCVVNLTDGRVHSTHKVCKGSIGCWSHLTIKDSTIYISCEIDDPIVQGVYAYDIFNPHTPKFLYQYHGSIPNSIMVDERNFIYVCDLGSNIIHQLTGSGQLMTIHIVSSEPYEIFYNDQYGVLYTTSWSNVITLYRLEYLHEPDTATFPAEILRMNNRSIQLFKEAMKDGEAKVYNIRVMVVGQLGVGKTTLIKRFLEKEVNIKERQSTEGIIVHVHCCKVSHDGLKWILNEGDSEQNLRLQLLAKVLNDQVQKKSLTDKRVEQVETIYQRDDTGRVIEIIYQRENKNRSGDHAFNLPPVSQDIQFCPDTDKFQSSQSKQGVKEIESDADKISDDPAMEMLKLLHSKADKLKQGTYIPLTISDFAGQFAFYTTHQTFLTDRAIYLLVSDISKHVTDPVKDDCYFDMEGIKLCKVYELVEVWLNSIHSCAPSPGARTPPVILVGTHVDQIQEDSREAVCQSYFRQIRYEYLGTKPTIVHLADEDFAIDNTVIDKKLDDLKKKIVQLASEQPYWGEAIPVRWLTLEEHLMSLKAAGVKVIPYHLLEAMNQKQAVKIESREELDLFLKFQHDVGNILYFGSEDLKDHIMLDPQWLIYSLRTIITAENFILQKIKSPAIIQKWREFKKTGKLTQELIDVIWTKENNPDCHDNKDLILHLMEQLNIIARPQSFSEDGDQVKVENCFLAPCMLNQKTPIEVIYPVPHPQMESSSVICYVFIGKYLPSPIFHRLLAACVAYWPIATKMNNGTLENLIFCGCCVFQLDHYHKLTIHFRDYIIFLRVIRKGITDKTPSSKLCIEARKFVSATLTKIIGCLGQSLKFEQYIQCPEYKGDSVNSLIPVSLLKEKAEVCCTCHDNVIESDKMLKFWFDDKASKVDEGGETSMQNKVSDIPSECQESPEGKGSDTATANIVPVLVDSSAPDTKDVSTPAQTSDLTPDTALSSMQPPAVEDTDRFMHIACLLVNVGSMVLRRLLLYHTVTPGCTLDQYLANNRIDIDDLRKRKILNKSQMDILFPPGGSTNLGDYDITLLSALFTNVVLTVSLQELNMIQFLRDKRNEIFAHAKSVAVNSTDYQTFWNDICRTQEALSKQCNDPDFENEILREIQGIQVSTVQGTSFLDTLQTHPRRIETLERLVQAVISSQTQESNKPSDNNDL